MAEQHHNTYEGFFLFPQSAATDLQGAVDHLKQILDRGDAQIMSFSKWDERRLAYEIKGNKRGIYFLTYFTAPGTAIPAMERACNLSEQLLRFMITRADAVPQELIDAAEGQAKLADEIRLRSERAAEGAATESARVESRSEADEAPKKPEPADKTEEDDDAGSDNDDKS